MKKLLLFAAILFTTTCVFAEQKTQPSLDLYENDILITTSGDTINCYIFAISDDEVKYKKEGCHVDFSKKKRNINRVLLSNGDSILYKNQTPTQKEKIKFNKEPFDQNKYKLGFIVGYESQQCFFYPSYIYSRSPDNVGKLVGLKNGKFSPTFKLGFIAHPEIRYGIGIKTGLNLNLSHDGDYFAEALKFSVDIPVQIAYRYQIVKDWSVFIYTGPIFEFGLYIGRGEHNVYSKSSPYYHSYPYPAEDKIEYRGFNCMWSVGIGIQYKRYRLTVGGEFGLNEITYDGTTKYYDPTTKYYYKLNKPIQVSVAVLF